MNETLDRTTTSLPLAPHHRDMLRRSGISQEIISESGYFTAESPGQLVELGFAEYQQRVPALVIPIHGVDGELLFHRSRPDNPREDPNKPGKVIKYEQPVDVGIALDVPRSARAALTDASTRLWIAEGEKKADALVSHGECAVALLGVWSWKRDGLPLPEWDSIRLIGREVRIAFDSDITRKVEVRKALSALAEYLEGRGARG